jgi:hypothetical protein
MLDASCHSSRSWLLFYIWLILYWVYAIVVIYWAYQRSVSGLSETLRMRLRVLHSVTMYVYISEVGGWRRLIRKMLWMTVDT